MDLQTRRVLPRTLVTLSVKLTILLPETKEVVEPVAATILNLNERGALLTTALEVRIFRELLKTRRLCRLEFEIPELPKQLMGVAVWNEPISKGRKTTYRLGLLFSQNSVEDLEQLRHYIAGRGRG